MRRSIIALLIITFLSACSEINTNNAQETYKFWTGTEAPKEVEVIEGQYWGSAHFSKEYIMYLKLKPSDKWWNEFVKQNNLILDSAAWYKANDTPTWFSPPKNGCVYKIKDDYDQGSIYYRDTISGVCYICEIKL